MPSFIDVLSLLSRSPRLTTLELDRYWQENEGDANALVVGPPIPFPHLDQLQLTAGTDYLTALLNSVVIPSTASLESSLNDAQDALRIRKFIVPLRRLLHSPGAPVFHSVCTHWVSSPWFCLNAHTGDFCPGSENSNERAHLKINTCPRSIRQVRSVITKLIHMLPLPTSSDFGVALNARVVKSRDGYSVELWKTIGRVLPQLKTVHIVASDAMVVMLRGLLDAMQGGTKGISGRRWRRITKKIPLNPSMLSLAAILRNPIQTSTQARYEALLQLLRVYRDMETVGKPKGKIWERIEFEPFRSQPIFDTLKDFLPRLKELTETLMYRS